MRLLGSIATVFTLSNALSAHAAPNGKLRNVYDPNKPALAATALLTANVPHKNGAQSREYLSQQQYEDIRNGTVEILRRYPPKKYFYVPVGRSPTAPAAFFEILAAEGTELSATVAASNLRDTEIAGKEAAWFAHLDQFLPKEVLTGNQKILLVDRSSTGATLVKTKAIFEQYLAARGSKTKVDAIAFSRREVPIPWIDVTNIPELFNMNRDAYVPWAEWPKYEVGVTPPAQLVKQKSYLTFKAQMLERMSRDAQLPAQLQELNLLDAR